MKPHTALIVDDERLARREVAYLLRDHPEIEVAGEAASVDEAVGELECLRPSLLFLDVQMPGGSGFDLFNRTKVEAHVIFVTAYDEFAFRAFEVNALDYLLKPVSPKRMRQAVDRYLHHVEGDSPGLGRLEVTDSIFLTIDQTPRFIRLASLECILAEGDYTRLVAVGGSVGMVLKTMKEWERILPLRHFCRIQRSTIINCDHVARLEPTLNGGYEVHMRHLEEPLIMSRRFARRFRARFGI
ncbi:MAG: LytTR family DNA-binding domain-containing protein [Acidobacteriota bacterium]|jgi:two-component system LytT family response regulator